MRVCLKTPRCRKYSWADQRSPVVIRNMDHLEHVRTRVLAAPVGDAPAPWTDAGIWAIGGLTEVGFGAGTDLLLVVSSQGRGVFDPHAGAKLARDRGAPDSTWHDEFRLVAQGIGPLIGQEVTLSGLHGGGLPNGTRDGWWAESITLAWPDQHLLLGGPWGWVFDETRRVHV